MLLISSLGFSSNINLILLSLLSSSFIHPFQVKELKKGVVDHLHLAFTVESYDPELYVIDGGFKEFLFRLTVESDQSEIINDLIESAMDCREVAVLSMF